MLASFLITFREALEAALIILEGMAALTAAIVLTIMIFRMANPSYNLVHL